MQSVYSLPLSPKTREKERRRRKKERDEERKRKSMCACVRNIGKFYPENKRTKFKHVLR